MVNASFAHQAALNIDGDENEWTPDRARQSHVGQLAPPTQVRPRGGVTSNTLGNTNVYASIRALSFIPGTTRIRNTGTVDNAPKTDTVNKLRTITTRDPTTLPPAPRSYWQRRTEMYGSEDTDDLQQDMVKPFDSIRVPGSITTLPVDIQIKLRQKVLMVFAIQLLLVTGILALLTYVKALDSLMHSMFDSAWYLLIAIAVVLLMIFMLNKTQTIFSVNYIAMLVFTLAFGVLCAGIQIVLNTNAGVFCCVFTTAAICIMIVLCSKYRVDHLGRPIFVSSLVAGFTSFVMLAILMGIVNSLIGWHFLSGSALSYALILEFLVVMWFGYDINVMFSLITPDEYMLGVIYFYTDLLVIAFLSIVATFVVIAFSACMSSGGSVEFISCNCWMCGPSHLGKIPGTGEAVKGESDYNAVVPAMER